MRTTGERISLKALDISLGISCGLVILGGLGALHYALEMNGWGIISSITGSLVGIAGVGASCWANSKFNPKSLNDSSPKESKC